MIPCGGHQYDRTEKCYNDTRQEKKRDGLGDDGERREKAREPIWDALPKPTTTQNTQPKLREVSRRRRVDIVDDGSRTGSIHATASHGQGGCFFEGRDGVGPRSRDDRTLSRVWEGYGDSKS